MKLVNFSHPLNDDAKRVLREKYGVTEIIHHPVHFNLNESLDAQVQAIVDDVRTRYGEPDVIIPPGYAPAAVLLAKAFPYRMVRLTAQGTPPKWMPAELLHLGANLPRSSTTLGESHTVSGTEGSEFWSTSHSISVGGTSYSMSSKKE